LSFEHGKQVPPGRYIIVVTVPIDGGHYYDPPYQFPLLEFSNSKTITIG